jgi:uncharacterized protein (DUF1015 family)
LATVIPFRAAHYNLDRYGRDITRFVAPPYDVIDRVMERSLKEDRLNITHITLGGEDDAYRVASRRLHRWLEDEVLVCEKEKCFYVYEQTFTSPDGKQRIRSGIIGLVRLEDFSGGTVLPHEKTIPRHKADRLELMRAVSGDVEQIFLLYDDLTGHLESLLADTRKSDAEMSFSDHDGVRHRILRISDPVRVDTIRKAFDPAKLFIADGHHRYETALECRDEMREKHSPNGASACDYVLATLVSSRNPGLVLYPTHRLIQKVDEGLLRVLPQKLEREFDLKKCESADALASAVEQSKTNAFGVWILDPETYLMATPKHGEASANPIEELPVWIVQEKVLKKLLGYSDHMLDTKINIEYVKGTGPTKELMESGEFQACFFVKPPTIDQVMTIAQTGQKMPHKSTYFYPKIWSGPLLYLFDTDPVKR